MVESSILAVLSLWPKNNGMLFWEKIAENMSRVEWFFKEKMARSTKNYEPFCWVSAWQVLGEREAP